MNEILVPHGLKKELSDIFSRSLPFIRKALRGKTNHPDAPKIRKFALEKGGIEQKSK